MDHDLAETKEKLDELEKNLIDYDASISEGNIDSDLVHIIFRTAHNLKSTLAFAGREHSSSIIHLLETHFDRIRHKEAIASSTLIDKCMTALDIIRTNISSDNEDTENSEKILKDLTDLQINKTTENTDIEGPNTLTIPLSHYEKRLLNIEISKNKKLYQLEKLITSDISEEDFEDLPIYQDIADAGLMIASSPKYKDINTDKPEFILKILFVSDMPMEELSLCIFDPFREVLPGQLSDKLTGKLRILIVEDDFISRRLLNKMLSNYGICDIAVDGREALQAFSMGIEENNPYDLICLDIMLPGMDGQIVLKSIRQLEQENNIHGLSRAKVLMTTALDDAENIFSAFRHQADGYIIKPITLKSLKEQMIKLDLL